jgi:hypothetical protein
LIAQFFTNKEKVTFAQQWHCQQFSPLPCKQRCGTCEALSSQIILNLKQDLCCQYTNLSSCLPKT